MDPTLLRPVSKGQPSREWNRTTQRKAHPLIDVVISIVVPSIILMKFSSPEDLGPAGALVTALSFPIGWGLYELVRNKRKNFIALLGLISVFLTGGIGLFELDTHWLAVKEAAVPRGHWTCRARFDVYAISARPNDHV